MTNALAIRTLCADDMQGAFALYNELTFGPLVDDETAFMRVIAHEGTSIFGAFDGAALVAMLTLHILPNPTWSARPYGLVENVITKSSHRNKGIGKALMQHAITCAWDADAFKVMLMTGNRRGAQGFYQASGFSSEDKTAMVIRRPDV